MGKRSLEDVIGIFGKQLRELGHKAAWDESNSKFVVGPGTYNVVVEGFTPKVTELIAAGYQKGARFLCLATEEPTPTGFNHGVQKEMRDRQDWFAAAAPYLDGIFHLVPGQHVTDWYSQHAPSAYVELGYADDLVRRGTIEQVYGVSHFNPPYDFGFYGSVSPRRMRLMRKLIQKVGGHQHALVVVPDFKTQSERDQIMRQAKVLIQIRKFDEMGLVSSSRCNTALMIGRPVVAEPHELSHPWDQVVTFAKTDDDFFSLAIMARGIWQSMHASQFTKFKQLFPPERCVGDALRAIGLTTKKAA